MWTSDYSIGRRYAQSFVAPYEVQYLLDYLFIESQVSLVRMPSLQRVRVSPFFVDNANGHFGGSLVIRTIESDSCDRITPEASPGFLG